MNIFDLRFKFIFYYGGSGGDFIARVLSHALPFAELYDTSYSNERNQHSSTDALCGLFHCVSIPVYIKDVLQLETNIVSNMIYTDKQKLIEFCFKLWFYNPDISNIHKYELKSFRLYIGCPMTNFLKSVVDEVHQMNLDYKDLPSGPYMVKGHHISWVRELEQMFPKGETIFISSTKDMSLSFLKLYVYKTTEQNAIDHLKQKGIISKTITKNEYLEWLKKDLHILEKYIIGYEEKNTSNFATYVFDANDLILTPNRNIWLKLFKIFKYSYVNNIIYDFIHENSVKNKNILENFKI